MQAGSELSGGLGAREIVFNVGRIIHEVRIIRLNAFVKWADFYLNIFEPFCAKFVYKFAQPRLRFIAVCRHPD